MHVSALSGLVVFAYVIVIGFIWRWLAAQLSETSFGQAMGILY